MIDDIFKKSKPKTTSPYSDLLPIKPKIKLKKPQKTFHKKQRPNSKTSKSKKKNFSNNSSYNPPSYKKAPNLPLIQIDYREKNSLVPTHLRNLNHKIELKELKVGDYLINEIIIERKEIIDLVQSIKNKRIFKQLEEMQQYPKKLLIIEGNIYSQKSLHPNAIKGFILSTSLNQKTPTILTNSPEETAKYISILSKKSSSSKTINPIKKQLSFEERQNYILQSFPNIGPKTSSTLLREFKSLKNIFNSTEKKLKLILGKNTIKFLNLLN